MFRKKGYIKTTEEGLEVNGLSKVGIMKCMTCALRSLIDDGTLENDDIEFMFKLLKADEDGLNKMLEDQLKKC